jgi:hypothetical protein
MRRVLFSTVFGVALMLQSTCVIDWCTSYFEVGNTDNFIGRYCTQLNPVWPF